MSLQGLADYYLQLSDRKDGFDINADNNTDNSGEKKKTRPAFSLEFFYGTDRKYPNGKRKGNKKNISSNRLLKAFFGDEQELRHIKNTRREPLSDEEIVNYSINGGYLNDAQKDALRKALSNNVTIIQGPPGTGKTEVILNILSCIHKKYPTESVMLLSGNFEAVKNITDKIEKDRNKYPLLQELYDIYLPLGNVSKRCDAYKYRKEHKLNVDFFDEKKYLVKKNCLGNIRFLSSTIHSVKKLYTSDSANEMQYDYVIVDECSQVNILVGIIAMSCGKRIILLGDREQLAPVIKGEEVDIVNQECGDVSDIYKEKPEKSFLEVCENIFGRIKGTTAFLSGHYRCHPSIINFCNKYVYDGKLDVCTDIVGNGMADADKLMMRVLWYEGDYFESYKEPDGTDKDGQLKTHDIKINQRQIDIFMNEELPYIMEKIREDKNYSVCVIAPFKAIIETLSDRIIERYEELKEAVKIPEDEDESELSRLTIHKAQGKGFDGVWFLSGQDAGSEYRWPWGQQKRMINVAVSRAKKEFTVITSSSWMPKNMQYALTGYSVLVTPKDNTKGDEKDNLMINKLIEYIENDCAKLDKGERFGIRKAKTTSIFDKNLYYRMMFNTSDTSKGNNEGPSAPELIMMDYLIEEYSRDYDILREIPFSAYSPEIALPECRSDFAICRGNEVLVIIEVDGGYHRGELKQIDRDNAKDEAIAAAKTDTVVARISTNDLNVEETIAEALNKALAGDNFITIDEAQKQAALERCSYSCKCGGSAAHLRKVIAKCFDDFCGDFKNERNYDAVKANNYRNPTENDYMYSNKMADDYYLCRYGMSYAFDYSLIYSLVLKSMANSGEQLKGLLSIGCGSMIDGWAMAFADSKLNYSEGHLPARFKYMGVDCEDWKVRFIDEKAAGEKTKLSVYMQPFSEVRFFCGDVRDHLNSLIEAKTPMDYNVICFPKILNELDNDTADKIAECFGKLEFPLDEYYICASHSREKRSTGAAMLKKIVDKINESGEFEVTYDLNKMNIAEGNVLNAVYPKSAEELVFVDKDVPCDTNCYVFKSSKTGNENAAYIDKIDGLFQNRRVIDYFVELSKKYDGISNQKDKDLIIRNVISKVSELTFQIVKLKRK